MAALMPKPRKSSGAPKTPLPYDYTRPKRACAKTPICHRNSEPPRSTTTERFALRESESTMDYLDTLIRDADPARNLAIPARARVSAVDRRGYAPRRAFAMLTRVPRLALASGLASLAAVAAVAVVFATAGTPAAYALTQNANGSYTLTINNLNAAIPQLNAKFAQMGIEETVVPVTANCTSSTPPGLVWLAQTQDQAQPTINSLTFRVGPLAAGDTGVIVAEQLANAQIGTYMGELPPPVPSCFSPATMQSAFPQLPATVAPTITAETTTPAN